MRFGEQLQFARDLLENMFVSSHIITDPQNRISHEIDLGLRSLLFSQENYSNILPKKMEWAKQNVIYRFVDEYRCGYIFMRLPDEAADQYFFIGPYMLALPEEQYYESLARQFSLPDLQMRQIRKYYANLPMIDDENQLLIIAKTLGKWLWGGSDQFSLIYMEEEFSDEIDQSKRPKFHRERSDTPFHLNLLEEHYAHERMMMEAVAQGKLLDVSVINSSVYNHGTEQRLSDRLRNRMNYLIIFNTLLRKAAEYGGVHPLHIDRLSSAFALRIERLISVESSIDLQKEMLREYCMLVRKYSLSHYSGIVGRLITLIEYDLTADLSLSSLADTLKVNPSYLSSLFRKELNCTLTDYVNRKRIERAAYLLNTTNKQIQNIASECGIPDSNYFIKIFRKQMGMTPTQYRRRHNNG